MRRLIAILAVAAPALLAAPTGASAEIIYPWCVQYSGGEFGVGATSCSFVSRPQCLATAQGMGATCVPNPAYPDAPAPYHRRPRR